jgi:hypothetical protein
MVSVDACRDGDGDLRMELKNCARPFEVEGYITTMDKV